MGTQISISVDFLIGILVVTALLSLMLVIFGVSRMFFGAFVNSMSSSFSAAYEKDLEVIASTAEPVPVSLIYVTLRKAGDLVRELTLTDITKPDAAKVVHYDRLTEYFSEKAFLTVTRDNSGLYTAEAVIV